MFKEPKGSLAVVRPAWAHTCGCKSRCELVTVSKAKRNCVRATERGKEAWIVNRRPCKTPATRMNAGDVG